MPKAKKSTKKKAIKLSSIEILILGAAELFKEIAASKGHRGLHRAFLDLDLDFIYFGEYKLALKKHLGISYNSLRKEYLENDELLGQSRKGMAYSNVLKRGWTPRLVGKYLGEPDRIFPHPEYPERPPMRIYDIARIEAAENSAEFKSEIYSDHEEEKQEPKHMAHSNVIKRGWTAGLIEKYLGSPDYLLQNPHGRSAAPMRVYAISRIEAIEASAEFKSEPKFRPRNSCTANF